MVRKVILRFSVLLLLPSLTWTLTTPAVKVANSFPTGTEKCLLDTKDLSSSKTRFGCVTFCQRNPSCLLGCNSGGKCNLYNANVSPHWSGASENDLGTTEDECYSLWSERKDLAPNATFVASSEFSPNTKITGVNDGFGCMNLNLKNMFSTEKSDYPWLVADLGEAKWISRVVVQARGDVNGWNTHLDTIEVRVGNTPGNGDFSSNKLLMYFEGPATYGEIVTFQGNKPLFGRFVSLQKMKDNVHILAMEMKIIQY